MSIRDWPEGERPREKLLARGSAALSDAELLALLLGSGSRGKDAIALGREVLSNAGSLSALLGQPEQQIRASGLGPAERARIVAALELARRSLAEELQQRHSLSNPRDSGDYLRARLRHLPYEVFGCLYPTIAIVCWRSRNCFAAPSTAPVCIHGRWCAPACSTTPARLFLPTTTRALPNPVPRIGPSPRNCAVRCSWSVSACWITW